ncbi:MAG TPA: ABC transporter permease [Gemmatimonadales bacterium]
MVLGDLSGDLRTAFRGLKQRPLFTAAIVGVLGLGMGAATLIFSIVSSVLLRPLPFAHPEQIAMIWGDVPQANLGYTEIPISGRYFSTLRDNARTFTSLAAIRAKLYNLEQRDGPERVDGAEVTSDFFTAIGVSPYLGRAFQRADETPGADHLVVVSWTLWKDRLGGRPSVLGSTLTLDGEPFTVIGVAPKGFAFPRGAEMPASYQLPVATELWRVIAPPRGGPSDLMVMGRAQPGVALAAVQQDLARVTHMVDELIPQGKGWWGTKAVPLTTQMVGDVRRTLLVLLGAVGLVLAIACANAAQLLFARLADRRKELAIREALGATTGRLTRTLLVEAFVLTLGAAVLGGVVAGGGAALVRALGPAQLPRLADVSVDLPVVLALAVLTILAGLAFGLVPAWGAARAPLTDTLRSGGRGSHAGAAAGVRRRLIVAEVALSVVLVAGSGLLMRSLRNELEGDLGFTAPHGLTFELTLPALKYPEKQFSTYMEHPQSVPFLTAALEKLRAVPGVSAVAIGKPLPMSGAQEASVFTPQGVTDPKLLDPANTPIAEYTVASPGLLAALGARLVAGRDFAETDREDTAPVAIINESMARWLWPNRDAIGRQIHLGGVRSTAPWMTVIGVAGNMKRYSLTETARPEMFVPYTQKPYPTFGTMQFVVRTAAAPSVVLAGIRRAVAEVDPAIPVARVRTMDALIADMSARARFTAWAITVFGAAALLLAAFGIYGLVAYTVSQRRQEFGLRSALGATPRAIVTMVLNEGVRLAGLAVGLGVVVAVLAAQGLRSLLFGVSAFDPLTLAATSALVLAATVAACALPALRASAVEPRVALDNT